MITVNDFVWLCVCGVMSFTSFYLAHDAVTDSNSYKEGQCLLRVYSGVLEKYTENTIDGAREFCKIHPVEQEKEEEEPKECTFVETTPERVIIDVGKTLRITRYPDEVPCLFGDVTVSGKVVTFESIKEKE